MEENLQSQTFDRELSQCSIHATSERVKMKSTPTLSRCGKNLVLSFTALWRVGCCVKTVGKGKLFGESINCEEDLRSIILKTDMW